MAKYSEYDLSVSFSSLFWRHFLPSVLDFDSHADATKESLLNAQKKIAELEKSLSDSRKAQTEADVVHVAEMDEVMFPIITPRICPKLKTGAPHQPIVEKSFFPSHRRGWGGGSSFRTASGLEEP